jgi:hypothetical protein
MLSNFDQTSACRQGRMDVDSSLPYYASEASNGTSSQSSLATECRDSHGGPPLDPALSGVQKPAAQGLPFRLLALQLRLALSVSLGKSAVVRRCR